jgi:hypothetical protein
LAGRCHNGPSEDSYEDEAVGHLEKIADGKLAITRALRVPYPK